MTAIRAAHLTEALKLYLTPHKLGDDAAARISFLQNEMTYTERRLFSAIWCPRAAVHLAVTVAVKLTTSNFKISGKGLVPSAAIVEQYCNCFRGVLCSGARRR